MRTIKKDVDTVPLGLVGNNLAEVINLTIRNHKKQIKRKFYADPSVVSKLKNIYNSKCAYCETYEPEPEVEHYRPKGSHKGAQNHSGYYWLCYEWSNLLPVCHDCNKTGTKSTHFPIEGQRQTVPQMKNGTIDLKENRLDSNSLSVLEIPLILNPEFPGYNPFVYFEIDSIGVFVPKANPTTLEYRKAMNTIECLRLNRDKLALVVRKKQIRYYMKRVKWILYKYLNGYFTVSQYEDSFLGILQEVKDKTKLSPLNEYWFFWNYFLVNFKFFLLKYFKGRFRQGLFDTYNTLIVQVV